MGEDADGHEGDRPRAANLLAMSKAGAGRMKTGMSTAKRLGLIAAGYVLAVCGGLAVVAVNELLMPEEISQTSGGMVAFGDMILFVVFTGAFGLAPTWFLLKLCAEKAPRMLVGAELVTAVLGPASWLAVIYLAVDSSLANLPPVTKALLGVLIAFGAIPRIIFGPILLVIEGLTFFLLRARGARVLLALAMLMDVIPIGLYALHIARMPHYT
jgi:hypothetical protein